MLQELVDAGPLLLQGVGVTLLYTALAAVAALVISFVLGLMAMSRVLLVRGLARVVVEFFRGTSLVVQLLWIFFVLPQLGVRFEPMLAATLAFGLNFGAYGSEVVRGAVVSVPAAQWEATVALGMNRLHRMRRIILPQAVPEMIPPFGNLLVQILKSSSLLFLVGITDLTFEVDELRWEIGTMQAYAFALVLYFVLAQLLLAGVRVWEGHAAKKVGRSAKPVQITEPEAVTTS